MEINNKEFKIHPESLASSCKRFTNGEVTCYFNMFYTRQDNIARILGIPFLLDIYSIFDQEKLRIGRSNSKNRDCAKKRESAIENTY